MKIENRKSKFRNFVLFCGLWTIVCGLIGCDAFVRKFTRKPKKEKLIKEEMVLEPIDYEKAILTREQLYQQYFLFWKSWQTELIESLVSGANHKKQVDCAHEAVKNLNELNALLEEEASEKLQSYILQLTELKDSIEKDIYGNNLISTRASAERIKRDIILKFSYKKIKDVYSAKTKEPKN